MFPDPIKMGWFGGFPIIFGNTHMNKSEDDFFFSQEPPSALNDETN